MQDLLFQLNLEYNIALIVATHNHEFADKIGRRVELRDGQLICWLVVQFRNLYNNGSILLIEWKPWQLWRADF